MKEWNDLPMFLQNDAVKEYYDILVKKTKSLVAKRIFDVLIASILFVLLFPLMCIIGLIIKLDSKGPVMFRQTRVTKYGKEFKIFKFRTMVNDTRNMGIKVTTKADSRVTGVGKILRKLRLDEIPQLLNVICGDMTFVGTRPEVRKYVDKYSDEMLATLLMPAGITSKASIEFKSEEELLECANDAEKIYIEEILPIKMEYNLKEIKRFSFMRDISIMIETVFAVIR